MTGLDAAAMLAKAVGAATVGDLATGLFLVAYNTARGRALQWTPGRIWPHPSRYTR